MRKMSEEKVFRWLVSIKEGKKYCTSKVLEYIGYKVEIAILNTYTTNEEFFIIKRSFGYQTKVSRAPKQILFPIKIENKLPIANSKFSRKYIDIHHLISPIPISLTHLGVV